MKHAAEASALAVVVRSVLDDLIARGKKPAKAVVAALVTSERFVAGEAVTHEALDEARAVYDRNEPDLALLWLQTAVGNLAWFCMKERGWQKGEASVMDAALYALSSLKVAGTRDHEALAALKAKALEGATVVSTKAPEDRPAKPARLKNELAKFISEKANKRLLKLKAVIDSAQRGDETALRALLQKHKLTGSAAVIAFDARYGGLVFSDVGEEGLDWVIGAHACLASKAHKVKPGKLVPVAYSPNDVIFYLDAKGAAWVEDTIDGELERFAADGDALIERIVLAK